MNNKFKILFSLIFLSMLLLGCTQAPSQKTTEDTGTIDNSTTTNDNDATTETTTNSDSSKGDTTETAKPKAYSVQINATDFPCSLLSTADIEQACGTRANLKLSSLPSITYYAFNGIYGDSAQCYFSSYDKKTYASFDFKLLYSSDDTFMGGSLENYTKRFAEFSPDKNELASVVKVDGIGSESVTWVSTNTRYLSFIKNHKVFEFSYYDPDCSKDKVVDLVKVVASRVT
ncbi:MAG: hypothetical protein Q7S22_03275 [Candidatus Micrarchaeota archaeon]|nr:hypothetical protein [Candidatus Micrarchaeota archaeon]